MSLPRKLILVSLTALAGLLGAAPLVIGMALQRTLPDAVIELDRQLGALAIDLVATERRWFTTDLVLAIRPAKGGVDLVYRSSLTHGPWPIERLAWLSGRGRLIHPELGTVAELDWRVSPLMNTSAGLRSHWQQAPNGPAMELDLRLAANRQLSQIRLDLRPSSIALPGIVKTNRLSGNIAFERNHDATWQAQLDLAADKLETGSGAPMLALPRLSVRVEALTDDVRLSSQIKIDRVAWEGSHDYANASADIALTGLHRKTLVDWFDALLAAHQSGLRGRYLTEKASGELMLALPALLAHRPGFKLESLRLESAEGPGNAHFELALASPPPPGFLLNPMVLIEVIEATGGLRLSQPLARHWAMLQARADLGPGISDAEASSAAEEFLRRLRANRLLVVDGHNYQLELAVSSGALTLNGQSMLLPTH